MRRCIKTFLLSALWLPLVAQAFVVSDIRVEGLQRISAGTVFATLPINLGDDVDQQDLQAAVRALFRTGNFDDIKIGRDGNVLVLVVTERPSISEINIEGNKAIETENLLDGLQNAGLSEGQVFKRSTLEAMKQELTRQYVSQGRYDATVDTDVVAQPRNRVAVNINIDEGSTAAIKHINIVGNEVYEDDELIDLFELKTTGWLSWLTSDDKYAREKLSGDLETLSSQYLDSGYLQFNIDSTQVAITPDREAVYITANVHEGEQYEVGAVELSGDIILEEEELRKFIVVEQGETFSQRKVTATEELLAKRLGNEGYNFAKVSGIFDVDEQNNTVDLKFFIDPGKRTYVRRIEFSGNTRTADEVLRREMRQMESAPASSDQIEQSRVRLERLGFFKEAKITTTEVPGTEDLIDLNYSVEEQPSGSIGASIGYAQDSGLLLGANIQQNNFLGSGKQIGVGLNKSSYLTNLRFSYLNPYFTEDGVSRGFSLFYREADLSEINVSSYTTNTRGATMSFGYPIAETERLGFTLGWDNTEIEAGFAAVQEIRSSPTLDTFPEINTWFESQVTGTNAAGQTVYGVAETPLPLDPANNMPTLADTGEPGFLDLYGNEFDNYTLTTSWIQNTLNRGQLATRGASQSLAFEFAVPGSDLEFFKLTYEGQIFFPLTDSLTLRLHTELGYGDGYGDLEELPFYENFYAGGFGSVRGYKSNTLGPRSTPAELYQYRQAAVALNADGTAAALDNKLSYVAQSGRLIAFPVETDRDPFGGDVLVVANAELLFPLPFIKDQRSVRSALFVDAGNVFSTNCRASQVNCFSPDFGELRYSAGVGVTWITGFGPMSFSLAKALNASDDDETEVFQFSLGRGF